MRLCETIQVCRPPHGKPVTLRIVVTHEDPYIPIRTPRQIRAEIAELTKSLAILKRSEPRSWCGMLHRKRDRVPSSTDLKILAIESLHIPLLYRELDKAIGVRERVAWGRASPCSRCLSTTCAIFMIASFPLSLIALVGL